MLRLLRPLAALTVSALAVGLGAIPAAAQSDPTEVHIGALLSITGAGSSLGNTSKAALEIGVEKLNKQLKKGDVEVTLDIYDTGQEPAKAQAGFAELADKGVKVIIGPQSSSEVAAISDAANQRGVLIVSQGSTASSLSIPDDNVFRFVPNDRVEARATADLIEKDGKKVIIPLWRNDRGNEGLVDSLRTSGAANGCQVMVGFRYEPDTTDFTTALQAIGAQVTAATQQVGAGGVAVYLAGFEEVSDVLAAAGSVPGLADVKWYGGDGSALASQLVENTSSVDFTLDSGNFPSPLVALPKKSQSRDRALIRRIRKRAHAPVDAFGLAAYDALQVAVKAVLEAGPDADGAALRAAFIHAADGYEGVTGRIELDAGGDRASAPYTFWGICEPRRSPARWYPTGTWTPGADPTGPGTLKLKGCPK